MQWDKIGIDNGKINHRYLVVGGDDRQLELARLFRRDGYRVAVLGMEKADIGDISCYTDVEEAVENSDIIIGPIPFSKAANIVNSVYSNNPIEVDRLLKHIDSSKVFLAGAINKSSREAAESCNIKYIDYYWDESYQIMNAIPTAEGTIAIAINETDITIHEANVLILGYGRIGKILAEYFKALGAEVFVEARKEHDIAWIKAKAMNAVFIDEISEKIGSMDIIINTIPFKILDSSLLDLVRKDTLIIDLASLPGGIDFEYAKNRGLKAIHALSIPGKTAYKTAALYIYDCIMKLLENS